MARLKTFMFVASVALVIVAAAPARADPSLSANDLQFLSALQQRGWIADCPANQLFVGCKPQGYVNLARNQCDMLRTGRTPRALANNDTWYVVPPGSPKAFSFVKAAIEFYCPQYLPQVDW
jgi:hypothetical protein